MELSPREKVLKEIADLLEARKRVLEKKLHWLCHGNRKWHADTPFGMAYAVGLPEKVWIYGLGTAIKREYCKNLVEAKEKILEYMAKYLKWIDGNPTILDERVPLNWG
jgi:hypothetical protein